jgi:hypothetical protein
VQIAGKKLQSLLNQERIDQYFAENVIREEDKPVITEA